MYLLQVLTPEQIFFDDTVLALIAPGEEGYLGILAHHAPLITSLKPGILVITDKNHQKNYYKISYGFLEVSQNKASIVTEQITPSEPVDIGTQGGI